MYYLHMVMNPKYQSLGTAITCTKIYNLCEVMMIGICYVVHSKRRVFFSAKNLNVAEFQTKLIGVK